MIVLSDTTTYVDAGEVTTQTYPGFGGGLWLHGAMIASWPVRDPVALDWFGLQAGVSAQGFGVSRAENTSSDGCPSEVQCSYTGLSAPPAGAFQGAVYLGLHGAFQIRRSAQEWSGILLSLSYAPGFVTGRNLTEGQLSNGSPLMPLLLAFDLGVTWARLSTERGTWNPSLHLGVAAATAQGPSGIGFGSSESWVLLTLGIGFEWLPAMPRSL